MTDLELEAFLEILRMGSISKAAEALFVTQPALSRRVKSLEEELGYTVFERKKGQRHVELTEAGEQFLPIAKQWRSIYREAKGIHDREKQAVFHVASVGSVSTYLLPDVMRGFYIKCPDIRLCFHNYHSFESYKYIEEESLDLAIISDDIYYKNVETIPAFREPMVLVTQNNRDTNQWVCPKELNPAKEIRLPWNPEYDSWHDYWFPGDERYGVCLDQMSLLEFFLSLEDLWAIVPYSVAYLLKNKINIYELKDGPPDRIIYYLKRPNRQSREMELFMELMKKKLEEIGDCIRIYR